MTHFDDELAALLAEAAAAPPPADLRDDVLRRALGTRAPGRPTDAATPCSAGAAYARTAADLHALLSSLADTEWDAVAHPEHGRVRDLIAHLIGVERLSLRWLDPDDDVPVLPDHVASTRAVVDALADDSPAHLASSWFAAAQAVGAAAAAGDPARPVAFHDLTSSIDGFLVTRTFELWAHGMDVAAATGRPRPELDAERMALMSGRLMAAVPLALAYRRTPVAGRSARFVLTGRAGGAYTVPLAPGGSVGTGEPDVVIVADTVRLCRLAARRLDVDALGADVSGDAALADLVLAGLDAFARD